MTDLNSKSGGPGKIVEAREEGEAPSPAPAFLGVYLLGSDNNEYNKKGQVISSLECPTVSEEQAVTASCLLRETTGICLRFRSRY